MRKGKGKFYLKVHEVIYHGIKEYLVAVCDEEILGKTFEGKKFKIFVNPRFYKGKIATEEEVLEELSKATIANLVGERIVKLAVEKEFVGKENVIKIKGVPHAQFLVLK